MARLPVKRLLSTVHETPMLLSAAPLEHTFATKRLPTTYTGRSWNWDRARTPAPPRSGPVASQRLPVKVALTMRSCPPRSKIAPPPPPSKSWPVELPSAKPMFWTVSRGVAWSWQCEVVHTCAWSQVSM